MKKQTKIQLSDHFTYARLLRFVFPSIVMMIFTSIYGVVDGLFVSNYVGKTPFAALNLIYPFLMIMGAVGFMFGTGGSAVVSQALGEGKPDKANQYFSMIVYVVIGCGIVLTVIGLLFLRPIAAAFGATGEMLDNCVIYGRIILCAETAFMLQNVFQSFLVTAERPQFGLAVTVAAGAANMVLDFYRPNTSRLKLVKTKTDTRVLLKTCINGSSELMTNISMSLVNILYNFQLIRYVGEDGIAAYGVIMYVSFIFAAIFIGYAIGSAPVVGYHYGAGNHGELKGLFRKSICLITLWNMMLTTAAIITAQPLAQIFVGYDAELTALTRRGFCLYSLSFLITGFNIFASAFFTALGNGVVSAAISFLRTLVFQIAAVMILPLILGLDGIWLSIAAAEFLALLVTVVCFVKYRGQYHYG